MPVPFVAYHGVSGNQHQLNFNKYSNQGFRMVSISVYGGPSNALYAAVWVKRSGPAYVATHGINAAQYQTFFNIWSEKGFVPVLISATGNGSNAIFAAVFEKRNYSGWIARHNITEADFNKENNNARNNNMILKTCTLYGGNERLYAGAWVPNTAFTKWLVYPNTAAANYQSRFDENIQLPYYKPEIASISDNHIYCSLFTDSIVGRWVARHGLTGEQYQEAFHKYTGEGLMPIYVDGGGTGSNIRYAVLFAETDVPLEKTWRTAGTHTASTAGLDNIVKNFMQKHAIRYAQLCVGKNGIIKYNKAFTWAEPNYKTAQASDRFLLASCSKMFLCAAVQSLFDAGSLASGDKAYAQLGFSNPKDSRSNDITIQHLLDHRGGFDAKNYDSTYDMRNIANDLGLTAAVSKMDIAKYMYKKKDLKDAPGMVNNYSNYGYLLLSLIIEKKTGKDYFQYLRDTVLNPRNITEIKVWKTVQNPRPADEVATESWGLGQSAVFVTSDKLVPHVYGGDGMVKEVAAASCGIGSSAQAMVQFIHQRAVWGTGGRMAGAARTGSTPGASTLAASRGDGIDYAYTINTRDFINPASNPLSALGADLSNFLDANSVAI